MTAMIIKVTQAAWTVQTLRFPVCVSWFITCGMKRLPHFTREETPLQLGKLVSSNNLHSNFLSLLFLSFLPKNTKFI